MSVLDKVRQWIDGDSAELVLEQAARDAQVKPRSQAEEFIVKIAREIESVMLREMVPLPTGTTIIPSEYVIFLSDADDKEWQGIKRRGLEQGLYHILAERAREIAGKRKLETKAFVIELRVDGTLEKGDLSVQHSWEDSSENKTGVLTRPGESSGGPRSAPPDASAAAVLHEPSPAPAYKSPHEQSSPNFAHDRMSPPQSANVQQAIPLSAEESEVLTNVRRRVAEIYRLEIWLNGVRQSVIPIYNNEISVGRGSKSKPVDIVLSGDPEVSRRHLTIGTDGEGRFWAVNEGRNPAMLNNLELPTNQRIPLEPGRNLAVGSYIIRIQPR